MPFGHGKHISRIRGRQATVKLVDANITRYAVPPLLTVTIKKDLKLTQTEIANSNIVALVATCVLHPVGKRVLLLLLTFESASLSVSLLGPCAMLLVPGIPLLRVFWLALYRRLLLVVYTTHKVS